MRSVCLIVALAAGCGGGAAVADDKADRSRKARVALALSTAPQPARDADREERVAFALLASGEACGACRADLESCRADSKQTGKALVVFVGGCESRGLTAAVADAIPCRVADYAADRDDHKASPARRVVILYPKGGYLYVSETLPPGVPPEELASAIARAKAKAR